MDLIFNQNTKKSIDLFLTSPGHLLLLTGKNGSGKLSVANHLIANLIGTKDELLSKNQFFLHIFPENNSISIEEVRKLQKFLKLKSAGNENIRRGVIIEGGESLTIEAQNALLKIFEEPPSDTVIVITSESKSKLLPTINSRAQSVEILPVSKKEAVIFFQKKDHNEIAINSAYLLSGGLIGLMNAVLEEDNSHPLKSGINEAKEILKSSKKDRLLKINDFSKDRQKIFNLIFSLERIADSGLTAAKNTGNSDIKRWLDILIASEIAEDALSKNANQKLLLTSLFMSI